MRLKDKVALVTGGSSGIGEAIAAAVAREGAIVAMVASSSLAKAEDVAQRMIEEGGRATAHTADVRSVASIRALVEAVATRHGRIDILVNSAGLYFPTKIGETTEEEFDRMMGVNLKGLFFLIDSVAPLMRKQGEGRIINIKSAAAFVGSRKYPLYSALKSAVVALTRALALQLAPDGIHINAIAPGNTETPEFPATGACWGRSTFTTVVVDRLAHFRRTQNASLVVQWGGPLGGLSRGLRHCASIAAGRRGRRPRTRGSDPPVQDPHPV